MYVVLRRIAMIIPMLLSVSLIVFFLVQFTLGDPTRGLLGADTDASTVAKLRHQLGLDQPVWIQYFRWLGKALQGDMGISFRNSQSVTSLIAERMPVTLELTFFAITLAIIVGFPLGIIAGFKENSALDAVLSIGSAFGVAIPNFTLGIIFILAFGIWLRWLPAAGYVPPWVSLVDNLKLMILPVVVLSLYYIATFQKYVRACMIEVLNDKFVLAAKARAIPARRVLFWYILKSGLIPTITVVGVETGKLFAGAVVIETMFALPGMGRLVVDSIFTRDFPVLTGSILFMTLAIFVCTLVIDILYVMLDPRVRGL